MSLRSIGLLGGLALVAVSGSYLMYGDTLSGVKLDFQTKFKQALLDLNKEDFWKEKWEKLKAGKVHGINLSLTKAKEKWEIGKLKVACKEIYEQPFEGVEKDNFLNFKAYCAFTNGEKLPKEVEFKPVKEENKDDCDKKKDELYLSETEFQKFKSECTTTKKRDS